MNTLTASSGRVAIETTAAALFSLLVGALGAWMVFSQGYHEQSESIGLLPLAASFLLFVGFALIRLTRITKSNVQVALATLCGIAVVAVAGPVLTIVVGCRYGACINL
jgi:hypothetical protein